jgi:hypothetical protein
MKFSAGCKSAPQYETDEGSLTSIQMSQIKKLILDSAKKKSVKSSLLSNIKNGSGVA